MADKSTFNFVIQRDKTNKRKRAALCHQNEMQPKVVIIESSNDSSNQTVTGAQTSTPLTPALQTPDQQMLSEVLMENEKLKKLLEENRKLLEKKETQLQEARAKLSQLQGAATSSQERPTYTAKAV